MIIEIEIGRCSRKLRNVIIIRSCKMSVGKSFGVEIMGKVFEIWGFLEL